jgi:hypothetical protein
MRLIHLVLVSLGLFLLPALSHAAGGAVTVRAIAFVASNERGRTDPQLAPYESVLRANLRFESFRYVGESSATVSAGGQSTLNAPGGARIQLQADAGGNVQARRGGTAVTLSPGRPAVFMGGPSGKGGVSGVIVML